MKELTDGAIEFLEKEKYEFSQYATLYIKDTLKSHSFSDALQMLNIFNSKLTEPVYYGTRDELLNIVYNDTNVFVGEREIESLLIKLKYTGQIWEEE